MLLTTYIVDNGSDILNGGDGITLREAVLASSNNTAVGDAPAGEEDGDIIVVNVPGNEIVLNSELTISDDVEIFDSSGTRLTIRASGEGHGLFNITTDETVEFRRMTLRDVDIDRRGGAVILGQNGDLRLDDVTFVDNTSFEGSAILMLANSSLEATETGFSNNRAEGDGAAFGFGGAILAGSFTDVTLDDTTFVNNFAVRDGGAIETKNRVTLDVNDTFFSSNTSSRNGGALATGQFSETTITGVGGRTIFRDNTALNGGGILVGDRSTVMAQDVDLETNTATASGGGLFAVNDAITTLGQFTATGNTAATRGGGLAFSSRNDVVLWGEDSVISGNTANDGGGLAVGFRSDLGIWEVEISNNDATGASGSGTGGGIFLGSETNSRLHNVDVEFNEALRGGGGIEIQGGSQFSMDAGKVRGNDLTNTGSVNTVDPANGGGVRTIGSGTTANFVRTQIDFNDASGSGAGIWNSSGSRVILRDGRLEFNAAAISGGGIYNNGGRVDVLGRTEVERNEAVENGGGLASDGGTLSVTGPVRMTGNAAVFRGGAISVTGGTATISGATIGDDGFLEQNLATNDSGFGITWGRGGGIYMFGDTTNVIVEGGTVIQDNVAVDDGGGIYNDGGTLTVRNGVKILQNSAGNHEEEDPDFTFGDGGGIYSESGKLTVENGVLIEDNDAGQFGGGIAVQPRLGSSIGGELFVYYGSIIRTNTASRQGGGIYLSGVERAVIGNSTVEFNSAPADQSDLDSGIGGGLSIRNSDFVRLTNNTAIHGNAATLEGGGLHVVDTDLRIDTGTRITNNSARGTTGGGGGGLFIEGGTTLVLGANTQIASNRAVSSGGGFDLVDATITVQDATITGNTSDSLGGGMAIFGTSNVTLERVDVFDNIADADRDPELRNDFGGGLFIANNGDDDPIVTLIGSRIFGNSTTDILDLR